MERYIYSEEGMTLLKCQHLMYDLDVYEE